MGKRKIQCFFLEPIDKARAILRRYKLGEEGKCLSPTGYGYHNASVNIDIIDWDLAEGGLCADDFDHEDPRWPKSCECGYEFIDSDMWQHARTRLHSRSDGGLDTTIQAAPTGAMWDAEWLPDNRRGSDGVALVVRTPDGDWQIDGPSSNGGNGWKRTGQIPDVTARPSILMPNYHGWLTNGVLIEC